MDLGIESNQVANSEQKTNKKGIKNLNDIVNNMKFFIVKKMD